MHSCSTWWLCVHFFAWLGFVFLPASFQRITIVSVISYFFWQQSWQVWLPVFVQTLVIIEKGRQQKQHLCANSHLLQPHWLASSNMHASTMHNSWSLKEDNRKIHQEKVENTFSSSPIMSHTWHEDQNRGKLTSSIVTPNHHTHRFIFLPCNCIHNFGKGKKAN